MCISSRQVRSLRWDQVVAKRLARSSLDARAPREGLLDVVRETCGVHAQLASGAELAISARVDDVTAGDVQDALWRSRELVKSSTVRGTLHLHPADDFPLWKALGAFGARWRQQFWLDWQGLTLAEAEQLRESVLALLADGQPRTRMEIGAAVGGRLGEQLAADSWGHYLAPASDMLCHGPPDGRRVTFVRCDRWVPGWRELDPRDAAVEACRRHLAAYGPVRRDELEHWLSQKLPDDVFAELAAGLEEVDVDGQRSLVPAGTLFPDVVPRGVRLLGHYDVYVIGCTPRERLIPHERERIFHRGAGPNPALLVDGAVAGTWARQRRGRRTEIRVEPFVKLTAGQRRVLSAEAGRVARTYDTDPVLEVL
jgi:hypothetical protein